MNLFGLSVAEDSQLVVDHYSACVLVHTNCSFPYTNLLAVHNRGDPTQPGLLVRLEGKVRLEVK